MSSSFTLQQTVNYASQTIRMAPLVGVGGIPNEPAFSMGNWVRQFILAPPFAWRWNRGTSTTGVTAGTNDTTITVNNFGWLEKAWFTNTTVTPNTNAELQISLNVTPDPNPNKPVTVCVITDNGSGVLDFRITPAPPTVGVLNCHYQFSSPNFQNLTDTWAPIPDYYYYLIETGFLAKTYEYLNDERYVPTLQMFVKQVIAANAGIADSQNNIYLSEFINSQREVQSQLGNSQSGRAGRGLFG